MSINTTNSSLKYVKSVVENLRADNNKLPFTEVLSSESINSKINDIIYRERVFSPELTVYGFLSQALSSDPSCQAAVSQIIAHLVGQGKNAPSANTSAYSQTRSRLPEKILSELAKESAITLEKQANPKWLWRNRHIKMPDTAENQAMYPQPASQKEGIGFPIARLVGVFSLSTGALPGHRTRSRVLVTTFLNAKEVTPQDLGVLYGHRWFVELNLRSVKEIMSMDILRGKKPEMVHKEVWAHVLAYNLVRKIMAQAAVMYK